MIVYFKSFKKYYFLDIFVFLLNFNKDGNNHEFKLSKISLTLNKWIFFKLIKNKDTNIMSYILNVSLYFCL